MNKKIDSSTRVAIHGFGKVGMPAALDLAAQGAKIVAVSDVSGGIHNSNGLDLKKAIEWIKKGGLLKDLPGAELISNEDLLALDVDVLIPAAISGVITEANANKVKAKIIAEGANGPLTKGAIEILSEKGIFIIPDILCNAGGVTVSYFEWIQGLQHLFWDLDQINKKLHDILHNAFHFVVGFQDKYDVDMKKAALMAALDRLQGAMKLRGMWPG